jgi:hypothetical protein
VYDPEKLSTGEEAFREMMDHDYTEEAFDEDGNFVLDLQGLATRVTGFNQVKSVDLNERFDRLKSKADWNAKEGKYEIDDPDNPGYTKSVYFEEVDDGLAEKLLRNDFKQMDTVDLFNLQHKYDQLSDEDKKNYPKLEDYWARQENKDELIKTITKQELQAEPKDSGTGKKTKIHDRIRMIKAIQNADASEFRNMISSTAYGGKVADVNFTENEDGNNIVEFLDKDKNVIESIDLTTEGGGFWEINQVLNASAGQYRVDRSEMEKYGIEKVKVPELDYEKVNRDIAAIQDFQSEFEDGEWKSDPGKVKKAEKILNEIGAKNVEYVKATDEDETDRLKFVIGNKNYDLDLSTDEGAEVKQAIKNIISEKARDKYLKPKKEEESEVLENPTQEQYDALNVGDKYMYNGVEYTKE